MRAEALARPYARAVAQEFEALAQTAPAVVAAAPALPRRVVRARAGLRPCGPAPFGYRWEGARLVVVPEQARVVRRIFARYLRRRSSVQKVVDQLLEEGTTGRRWSRPLVAYLLRNAFYAGVARWGDLEVAGQHAAIVSRETWDRVQARLGAQRRNNRVRRVREVSEEELRRLALAGDAGALERLKSRWSGKRKRS